MCPCLDRKGFGHFLGCLFYCQSWGFWKGRIRSDRRTNERCQTSSSYRPNKERLFIVLLQNGFGFLFVFLLLRVFAISFNKANRHAGETTRRHSTGGSNCVVLVYIYYYYFIIHRNPHDVFLGSFPKFVDAAALVICRFQGGFNQMFRVLSVNKSAARRNCAAVQRPKRELNSSCFSSVSHWILVGIVSLIPTVER